MFFSDLICALPTLPSSPFSPEQLSPITMAQTLTCTAPCVPRSFPIQVLAPPFATPFLTPPTFTHLLLLTPPLLQPPPTQLYFHLPHSSPALTLLAQPHLPRPHLSPAPPTCHAHPHSPAPPQHHLRPTRPPSRITYAGGSCGGSRGAGGSRNRPARGGGARPRCQRRPRPRCYCAAAAKGRAPAAASPPGRSPTPPRRCHRHSAAAPSAARPGRSPQQQPPPRATAAANSGTAPAPSGRERAPSWGGGTVLQIVPIISFRGQSDKRTDQ